MSPALKPGDKLGPFEVQQQLASGGMGIVWRGYDELLGRHAAIKQIAEAGFVDEAFRQRFRREGELQKRAAEHHPNVVPVIDAIDEPRGLFLVTEYVEGRSLEQELNETGEPIEPKRALAILRDAARGLTAIHAAGIVHRDLKPGNILLPADGSPVRICDFGVAALVAEQDTLQHGTSRYMAPELFRGEQVDARADVYSLGFIGYEMLAGRSAFENSFKAVLRDRRQQAMRWMKWHTNTRATAPPLTQLNDRVPEKLAELVERMIAKEPARRIGSADEVLQAIQRHFTRAGASGAATQPQAAPPADASPATPEQPAAASSPTGAPSTAPLPTAGGRTRLVLIALGVLVFVQLLGLGGYLWYDHLQRQRAVAQRHERAERRFGRAMSAYEAAVTEQLTDGARRDQLEQARQGFANLAERWPEHVKFGTGARGYALLCDARLAMMKAEQRKRAAEYNAASEAYAGAAAALRQADQLDLPPAASKLRERIGRLRQEVGNRNAFVQTAHQIAAAVEQGDFETARRKHREVRRLLGDQVEVLTASERKALKELGKLIDDQQLQRQRAEAATEAQELAERGELTAARDRLREAIDELGGNARLQDQLRQIEQRLAFRDRRRAAREAEDAGELSRAVELYQRAHRIRPDEQLDQKIAELRSEIAFRKGREMEEAGQPQAAAQKYIEARSHHPHAQAKERLDRIKLASRKDSVLATADDAFEAGDFEQAADLYRQALDLSPDERTRSKLRRAKLKMHARAAEQHLKRGDVDKARAAVRRAMEVDDSSERAQQLRAAVEHYARFQELVAKGDRLRSGSEFGSAKAAYQDAIDLAKKHGIPHDRAVQRKLDAEFDDLLARARSAIDLSLWKQAEAFLNTALHMRPQSERARRLQSELQEKRPEEGSA